MSRYALQGHNLYFFFYGVEYTYKFHIANNIITKFRVAMKNGIRTITKLHDDMQNQPSRFNINSVCALILLYSNNFETFFLYKGAYNKGHYIKKQHIL